MNKSLTNNIYSFYISLILVSLSKSFPHSILTIVLLDKGLTLSNIIFVQSMFSLAIFLFEIPSGVWADLYSRKRLYLYSNSLLLISYFIIIYFNNFYIICLVWFLYGLSEALNSGTLEAQIINDVKKLHSEDSKNQGFFINKFIKGSGKFSLCTMIFGSILGSYLYFFIGIYFYYLSIIMIFLSIVLIKFFFKESTLENNVKEKVTLKLHIKYSLIELKKSNNLKVLFLLSMISQIFFQTHYQLWQAIFLEKGYNSKNFYIIYVVFQLLNILVYYVPIIGLEKKMYVYKYVFLLTFVPIIMILSENKILFVGVYLINVFIFTLIDYILTNIFANKVSPNNISSLISMKSSLSRIMSIIVLVTSSYFLKFINVEYIVITNFIITIIFITITLIIFSKKENNFNDNK